MRFMVGNSEVSVSANAKRKFFDPHWSRNSFGWHLIIWKLSIHVDYGTREVYVCEYCDNMAQMIGEDGIDYCPEGCGAIEGHAHYVNEREWEARQ